RFVTFSLGWCARRRAGSRRGISCNWLHLLSFRDRRLRVRFLSGTGPGAVRRYAGIESRHSCCQACATLSSLVGKLRLFSPPCLAQQSRVLPERVSIRRARPVTELLACIKGPLE